MKILKNKVLESRGTQFPASRDKLLLWITAAIIISFGILNLILLFWKPEFLESMGISYWVYAIYALFCIYYKLLIYAFYRLFSFFTKKVTFRLLIIIYLCIHAAWFVLYFTVILGYLMIA